MDIDHTAKIIAQWAVGTDFVAKAWIFGSRARLEHRESSDLDVAITVMWLTETPYTRFWFDHLLWQEALQRLLPLTVHLCYYDEDYAGHAEAHALDRLEKDFADKGHFSSSSGTSRYFGSESREVIDGVNIKDGVDRDGRLVFDRAATPDAKRRDAGSQWPVKS